MSSLMTFVTTTCLLVAIVNATPTETDPQDFNMEGTVSSTKCVYLNQKYEQGQIFWPDRCHTCICGAGGMLSCSKDPCEELICLPYHHEQIRPGECCSSCVRSTCYWKGRWYEGGDMWTGNSLDNGRYCKLACRCEAEGNVTCNKSDCGSISNGNARGEKVCQDDGKRYNAGQNWTKQTLYRGRQCRIACTCKKSGKATCNKKDCKTAKPIAKYQLRTKGNRAPCSDPFMGERQHRDRFLYYLPNNSNCVKECLCLSGTIYCNMTSCTQASEQMPTCGLIKGKAKQTQAEGCISIKKQPTTQCPQYCARNRSMKLVKCCRPVKTAVSVRFKCTDGRRLRFNIPQVTGCKCSANCNFGEDTSTTSGDVPALQ
ncbi:von Willebrand factor C and EGF domain-containing protein-like [Corticium candelabrum]|uniref:von Willebrand factor C and EGF domain-containing protein-like n=1 Tax=Corticium candelabrum TaxID=121492 RepID=UPI002E274C1A|nr:von Willebrand factor C and EGF domain-containing protein-like [Corticium candelabrum]XP_062518391.1 von Willebrand factor C and EGF domain-containing protein-like [Corticium candelabrum]